MKMRLLAVAAFWILSVGPAIGPLIAHAQTSEATISGVVSDATGGALPGVTVTAIHGETGQRHTAVTNAEGFYALRSLPIGPYVIEAELSGFQKHRRQGLTLTTGATVPLDIRPPSRRTHGDRDGAGRGAAPRRPNVRDQSADRVTIG
jgi:hypothetical protein